MKIEYKYGDIRGEFYSKYPLSDISLEQLAYKLSGILNKNSDLIFGLLDVGGIILQELDK